MNETLSIPKNPKGIIVFAHGSGSSQLSARNRMVAQSLQNKGFATLLFDLLSSEEIDSASNIFDISLLTRRLLAKLREIEINPRLAGLPIGLYGSSTGAAAALKAASILGSRIQAVVSRGGRPDLVMFNLPGVTAATLLIVGEKDRDVLHLNQRALAALRTGKLSIVPSASHLFEEAGALEMVSDLSAQWFSKYLLTPAREPKRIPEVA